MSSQIEQNDVDVQDISTRTGLSILQIMWQRKSLVVLGIMLGLVLGLLYYAQRQPTYQSTAQILIVKKSPDNPIDFGSRGDGRMAYMDDYMSTQQTLVRSPAIVGKAIKMPKIKDLKTFTSDGEFDRIYDIQQMLVVARDNRESNSGAPSNILNLSFRGSIPDECRTILEGIIESYQVYLDTTYKSVSDKTFELITEAKATLEGKFQTDQAAYLDWRMKSPWGLSIGGKGGQSSVVGERLAKYEGRRSELKIKLQEMNNQLAGIEKVFKEGGANGNAMALQKIRALGVKLQYYQGEPGRYDQMLLEANVNKRKLMQVYGANHPVLKELDETINEILRISGRGKNASDAAITNNPDDAQAYISTMKEELADLDTRVQTLSDMIEKEIKDSRDNNAYEVTEERLRTNRDNSQKLLDVVVQRLGQIDVIKNFGGYTAEPIAQPGLARKVAPNAMTVFPLAGIGGLVAGLCLAYLAELSDKSFRTPAEIRRRLGLPVIGHIPYYAADEKAAKQLAAGEPVVDPMLCTHYQSNSVSSEAFRSVRTALYFNTHGVGHQVIQITSPNVSDGKSTLAANLAVSIAQSGKRTIMIDGDCRRPRIHKIFNVPADTGLATVIGGQADLASAIRPTSIPNLSVLPCGPRPANPAELLTSPRFKEMLDIIRSQYDFVIIDTPPLLVVTDPCVVAPRADGVILAIRVTKNGRPFAERAKEILTSLGANVLGVVVNGLGSPAGGKYGYGYDQYQYGYGYTYRYSYTYTDEYTDDKAASYYNTEPTGDAPPNTPLENK